MFYRYSDQETRDDSVAESLARELAEQGPVCAGCGERCGSDWREVDVDECYCGSCQVELADFIAQGVIPHGGTLADPDSLRILGVR